LMVKIEPDFGDYLKSFEKNMNFEHAEKVVSNFTGTFYKKSEIIGNLVKQISGTVRWIDNMKVLQESAGNIIEIGPNRVLGKFFQSMNVTVSSIINIRSLKKTLGE